MGTAASPDASLYADDGVVLELFAHALRLQRAHRLASNGALDRLARTSFAWLDFSVMTM